MSSTLSDPLLAAAFWTGFAALIVTLLLAGEIVNLRMALRRRQRREQAALAKWRPVLNAAIIGDIPESLPRLRRGERLVFLKFWVHLHQSLRGSASADLNEVAMRLRCDVLARELLVGRRRAARLLATLVLGHLRDRESWDLLQKQAASDDSTASLYSLWALVQIDPKAAAGTMMPFFIGRDDWALSQVVSILQEAREDCAEVLEQIIPELSDNRLPRALQLAEALRADLPPTMQAGMLRHESVTVLVTALRIASSPAVCGEVRAHVAHPDWRVRVQVAKALGRIGGREDVEPLTRLLNDSEWWVRYRAAQALAELPFLEPGELERLRNEASDRYAADMLTQVLAEKEMA
ncbi:HEAT repeat domain-containing protein [Noviherbaspirillum aerium]|uniref:HEAT repeat domain-containing protein n=1 Tax=Noviherbaspirillum aerium TaxID=2588497 RepID=UPI00124DDA5B|nr:HEAT repeat domain-containing protein [Noviherbaspirillum aerium]